jgi:hypothetical protein
MGMGKKFNPGCHTADCCGSPACYSVILLDIYGCNANTLTGAGLLPGAVVNMTGPGGFSATATSDIHGVATFNVIALGTYNFTVTATGFVVYTGSIVVTSCSGTPPGPTLGANVLLTSDSSHTCGVCCSPYPIPKAGTLTVAGHTVSLTFDGNDLIGSFVITGSGHFVTCGHNWGDYPFTITCSFGVTGSETSQCDLIVSVDWGGGHVQTCGPGGWAGQTANCNPFNFSWKLYGCDTPYSTINCHSGGGVPSNFCECNLGSLLGATSTTPVFFTITYP